MLPKIVRHSVPDSLRHSPRLRPLALRAGLIPPRTMHSPAESALLRELAQNRRRAVEIGVYEGSSAAVLCEVLDPGAELHLIDPFGEHGWALPAGWGATEGASRRVVDRARRRHHGPQVTWHVDYSAAVAARWQGPVDLVFIDGDHSEDGVRADWDGWNGFVEPGGAVVFHDARLTQDGGRGLPGPTAVVDGLFRGPDAAPGWRIAAEADRTVAVVREEQTARAL